MNIGIGDAMRAAIGGAISGVTNRSEALEMVQAPIAALMNDLFGEQPPSVELATNMHDKYGIDLVFKGGKLENVVLR